MSVCENSDEIDMSKAYHNLYLSGEYTNMSPTQKVLICASLGFDKDLGCVVKLRGKSEDEILTYDFVNAL